MSNGAVHQPLPAKKGRHIPMLPTTRLGRWAVRLAVGFPVFVLAWTIVPGGAAIGFASGLAGGVGPRPVKWCVRLSASSSPDGQAAAAIAITSSTWSAGSASALAMLSALM